MGAKLSSLLVQEGVVTVRRVEEALQRQVIYGGSLGTNLLEMNAITEGELLRALSTLCGLEPADGRWLEEPSPDAHAQFPRKLVERHHILPVGITSAGAVRVVVSEDAGDGVLEALAEELEVVLEAYVVPEYRFQYGLERHYQVPMRSRYARLMRELSRRQSSSGAQGPPQRYRKAIERLDAGWGAPDEEAKAWKAAAEDSRSGTSKPDKGSAASRQKPTLKGRLSRKAGAPDNETAAPDENVEGPPSAVPASEPSGEEARQPSEDLDEEPTAISAAPAPEGRARQAGEVDPSEPERTVTPQPRRALALRRAAADLDEAESREDVLEASLGYLKSRLTHAWAFTLGKDAARLRAWEAPGAEPPDDLTVDLTEPSILKTLASAGGLYVGPVPPDMGTLKLLKTLDDDPPAGIIAVPVLMRERPVLAFVGHADGFAPPPHLVAEFASFAELVAAALANVILRQKGQGERTMSLVERIGGRDPAVSGIRPSRTMLPPPPDTTASTAPVRPQSPPTPAEESPDPDERGEEIEDHGAGGKGGGVDGGEGEGGDGVDGGDGDGGEDESPADAPWGRAKTPDTGVLVDDGQEEDEAPNRRRSVTPRSSTRRTLSPEEETFIEAAVRRLCEAEPDEQDEALAEVVEFGEQALYDLMQEFPGPIDLERQGLEPGKFPAPERFGPVIAALRKLGEAAVEELRGRLSDHRPKHRFHAVQLLGARIDSGLMPDLANAVYDDDPTVRAAAADAMIPLKHEPGYAAVRKQLFEELSAGGPRATTAGDALVSLREPEAAPKLIETLASKVPSARIHAHRALRILTRFDKGAEPRKWRSWWRKYGSLERVEWLIDALIGSDRELRAAAAEELHRLTDQRIPFNPDGGRREWKRARKAWLAWYRG